MDFKPEKKLGFGLMRLPLNDPTNEADVDVELVSKMVDVFLEKGFTYFDTAWPYHDFNSENVIKTALTDRYPRDRYTLATKLHAEYVKNKKDRDRIAIPCTGCSYCTSGCPKKICIPRYFDIYNENTFDDLNDEDWTVDYSDYLELSGKGSGRADDCLACGKCESICPQHLPIIENLKKVASHFEEEED